MNQKTNIACLWRLFFGFIRHALVVSRTLLLVVAASMPGVFEKLFAKGSNRKNYEKQHNKDRKGWEYLRVYWLTKPLIDKGLGLGWMMIWTHRRNGLCDIELMKRYKLSKAGFARLCQKLRPFVGTRRKNKHVWNDGGIYTELCLSMTLGHHGALTYHPVPTF